MSYNPKNYSADGGDRLVIGGTLEIESGATVTGAELAASYTLPTATTSALGGVKQAAAVADLGNEADLADVVAKINALLAAMRTAGALAT